MLELRDVSFSYRSRWRREPVMTSLSWSVPERKRVLLLGPNGAGKSTLLELLSGLRSPRRGHVVVEGATGRRHLVKNVALMPQTVSTLRGLTVTEQVAYSTWLRGTPRSVSDRRAEAAVIRVRLEAQARSRVNELSGGQRRRVGIAEALASEAPYILLDEPMAGLDPSQRKVFSTILDDLSPAGSVVVSTHELSDVDASFDHVTVLVRGSILFDGSMDAFKGLGSGTSSIEEIFVSLIEGGLH